jgi:hypothetical protein
MMRRAAGPIFIPTLYFTRAEKMALWACFCTSLYLIGRLWLSERKDRFGKKLFWSFVLLIPVIGWVFYGAFYRPLSSGNVPPSNENPPE